MVVLTPTKEGSANINENPALAAATKVPAAALGAQGGMHTLALARGGGHHVLARARGNEWTLNDDDDATALFLLHLISHQLHPAMRDEGKEERNRRIAPMWCAN